MGVCHSKIDNSHKVKDIDIDITIEDAFPAQQQSHESNPNDTDEPIETDILLPKPQYNDHPQDTVSNANRTKPLYSQVPGDDPEYKAETDDSKHIEVNDKTEQDDDPPKQGGSRRRRRYRNTGHRLRQYMEIQHELEHELEALDAQDPNRVVQDIINLVENKPEPFGTGGIIKTRKKISSDDAQKISMLCATYYYQMEHYVDTTHIDEMYKNNDYFRDLPRNYELKIAIDHHQDLDHMDQHSQIINFPIHDGKDIWMQYKKYYTINEYISKLIIGEKCDIFDLHSVEKKISNEISVSNLVDITYLQLYPQLSKELERMIGAMGALNIENEEQLNDILQRLQSKTGLVNEQLKLLKYVVNKYRYYQAMYDAFSISFKAFCGQGWNEKDDERRLWEIYSVHKVFRNHSNPCLNYNIFNFCDEYLKIMYPEKVAIYLLMNRSIDAHPLYVINDDMEQVMEYVMSTSYLVQYITHEAKQNGTNNVNIIIIPNSIESSMDKASLYERDIPDLSTLYHDEYTEIKIESNDREWIYDAFKTVYDGIETDLDQGNKITIIVDRRGDDDKDKVYLYSTSDCDGFEALFSNYCLSFTFHIVSDQVVCYLWCAIYEKVRFFPEMMVSIVPKLFNKRLFDGNQYKRIQLIYSHSFKNGFGVHLEDDEFNDLYKQITQYTHICNNYNRDWIHKDDVQIIVKQWSELKEECNAETPLNECLYINNMIQILKAHRDTNELIQRKILNDLQLNYDHIIRCHGLFKNKDNRLQITQFIAQEMNQGKHCEHGHKCPLMLQHINTKKESYRHEGGCDSLFVYLEENGLNTYQSSSLFLWMTKEAYDSDAIAEDLEDNMCASNTYQQLDTYALSESDKHKYMKLTKQHMNISKINDNNMESLLEFLKYNGIKENTMNALTMWCIHNEYDTDCIADDVSDAMEQSNIFGDALQEQHTHAFNLIKIHVSDTNAERDDADDIIAKRTFNSIHTYLLHSGEELYRTKNHLINARLRFATEVQINNQENDDINESRKEIYQIDFGKNVLKWLSYGEEATFSTFRDEIIFNPLSTIDEGDYEDYENECRSLCASAKSIDIEIHEMISLKLYTDTTKYQSALRRAFWMNIDQEQKRNFYQWAITLYRTFQRYEKPPYCTKLYHGLNAVFVVESAQPQYNGIFSSSMQFNVAHQFSDGTGVLWEIETSYSNPFKLMVGISTAWFSAFKNEAEFVVFNSLIPINNVRNFTENALQQIDILLKQLQVFSKRIVDKKAFYKNIGVGIKFKMPKKWKRYIRDNMAKDVLYAKSVYSGYCVLHRLVNELGLWNDVAFGRVLLKHHTVDIQSTFGFGALRMELTSDDMVDLKECEYIVNMDRDKVFDCNDDIVIRDRNKTCKVYVRNHTLFGHDAFMLLSIYDASEFNDIDAECGWTQRLKVEAQSGVIVSDMDASAVDTEHIVNARYIVKGSYFDENNEKEHVLLNDIIYTFADVESFRFEVTNDRIIPRKYHIYVSPANYKAFWLMKHSNLMNKSVDRIMNIHCINIAKEVDVSMWNKVSKKGGCLQIYSGKALIINENGCINASGCGYCCGTGIGRGKKFETHERLYCGGGAYADFGEYLSGKTYGSKRLDRLQYGSPCYYDANFIKDGHERGGGIIELIANEVINYGNILCNGYRQESKGEESEFGCGGSGGSIKIKCKTFINKGIMECKGAKGNAFGVWGLVFNIGCSAYGRIAIECEEYQNNGTICPEPYIEYTRFRDKGFTEIECYDIDEAKQDDMLCIDSFIDHCKMLFIASDSGGFDVFKAWCLEEEYDTDAMRCDLKDKNCSNMIGIFEIFGVVFADALLEILHVEQEISVESYFKEIQTEAGFALFKQWCLMEEYDSDAMAYDLEDNEASNLADISQILLCSIKDLNDMDSFLDKIKIRFDVLNHSDGFNAFVSWCSIEEFDSDAIVYDIEDEKQSNVHSILDIQLNANNSDIGQDEDDDKKQNEMNEELTVNSFLNRIKMKCDFLNLKSNFGGFESWCLSEAFDSDAIEYDIDDREQSNLYNILQNTLVQNICIYERKANQNNFYDVFHDRKQQCIYQYKVEQCLVINSKLDVTKWNNNNDNNNGGILQIQCMKELMIGKTGYIDADCCGYSHGFGIGRGETVDECYFGGGGYGSLGRSDPMKSIANGGISYGNKKLDILHRGSPSGCINEKCALGLERGGGIIELIAETIINYGVISCNGYKTDESGAMMCYGGSGGCIKLKCRQLVNKGVIIARGATTNTTEHIGAGGYGRIAIYCETFTNEGTFYPIPYVEYTEYSIDYVGFTPIAHHNETQHKEEQDGDDETMPLQLNQNNFYQMFYDSEHLCEYELESLIINSALNMTPWNEAKNGGVLQIYCKKTLTIEKGGRISGDCGGYYYPFGTGRGHQVIGRNKHSKEQLYYSGGGYGTMGDSVNYLFGGSIYGTKQLNVLYMGSPSGYNESIGSGGGGIIELISETIVNNGWITCCGFKYNTNDISNGCSGGSIKFRCKTFINNGIINANGAPRNDSLGLSITAGGQGRIAICCQEYTNHGRIDPKPYIENQYYIYNDDIIHFQFTEINKDQRCKETGIKLDDVANAANMNRNMFVDGKFSDDYFVEDYEYHGEDGGNPYITQTGKDCCVLL